jgi:hypothetical protein
MHHGDGCHDPPGANFLSPPHQKKLGGGARPAQLGEREQGDTYEPVLVQYYKIPTYHSEWMGANELL